MLWLGGIHAGNVLFLDLDDSSREFILKSYIKLDIYISHTFIFYNFKTFKKQSYKKY